MIYIGNKKIGRVFLGETELNRIYLGEDLIFQKDQPIVYKTIRDLIDEEYAETVTGSAGTYIRIKSTCPYQQSQITDLEDFAFNRDQLTSGVNNTIIWDVPLPSGWTSQEVADIYDGQSLPFTPRANIFWALDDLDSFTITFTGGSWSIANYPWGNPSGANGIFSPRYNANNEAYYNASGFRDTPETLTVNISSTYSSVAQTMFTELRSTTTLNLNINGDFDCHDCIGMFEASTGLVNLNITGVFLWSSIRACTAMFDGCTHLTSIPVSRFARDHNYNKLYPRLVSGPRGTSDCTGTFRNCTALTYIGPTINMNAISLNGCVVDNISQPALGGIMFGCPNLTDVMIINLNNNSWNFADTSTYTYIPKMNVASIEYLLNNVADCTADPHTVTFSTLHQGEISQSAIDAANAKGWTVAYQAAS